MKDKIKEYINNWKQKDYLDGIPDEVPNVLMDLNLAPSYKAICIAILKNDHSMQSLGFTPKPSIYYNELKRIEIMNRNKIYLQITISESLSIIRHNDAYRKHGIQNRVNEPTLFDILDEEIK